MNTIETAPHAQDDNQERIRAMMLRVQYVLFATITAVITPLPALAQTATGGTSSSGVCSGGSGTGSFNLTALTTILQGIANLFANTYVKIGIVVGIAIGVMMLFFDGGQLPQVAKVVIGGLIGVALVFALIGYIVGSSSGCGTTTAALITWVTA